MKKQIIILLCLLMPAAALAQSTAKELLISAVEKSDFTSAEKYLQQVKKSDLDDVLKTALRACDKDAGQEACNRQENAKILTLLAQKGANLNRINLESSCPVKNCGTWQIFKAVTAISLLKKYNPAAIPAIMPYTDKCLVAITQIEESDPQSKDYAAYVDFWRTQKCSLKNFESYSIFLDEKEDRAHALETGLGKDDIKKIYGEPTVYEHPAENDEVLTYKKAEKEEVKYSVEGLKGQGKSIYTNETALIFTLKRGIVTKVEKKELSSTRAGGETQTTDFDALQKAAQAKTGGRRGR